MLTNILKCLNSPISHDLYTRSFEYATGYNNDSEKKKKNMYYKCIFSYDFCQV